MYKVFHGIAPDIICNIFSKSKSELNLRNKKDFDTPRINTVYWGSNSLRYLGPQIWNIVSDDIKASPTLARFKTTIKERKPENCQCRL